MDTSDIAIRDPELCELSDSAILAQACEEVTIIFI